jgi:hypothetical protein
MKSRSSSGISVLRICIRHDSGNVPSVPTIPASSGPLSTGARRSMRSVHPRVYARSRKVTSVPSSRTWLVAVAVPITRPRSRVGFRKQLLVVYSTKRFPAVSVSIAWYRDGANAIRCSVRIQPSASRSDITRRNHRIDSATGPTVVQPTSCWPATHRAFTSRNFAGLKDVDRLVNWPACRGLAQCLSCRRERIAGQPVRCGNQDQV